MTNTYVPRKEDGWLDVESVTPEGVTVGTIIDVVYRNGDVLVGVPFGSPSAHGYCVATFEWNASPTDILFYRMYTEMSEAILQYTNVERFVPLRSMIEEQDRLFEEQQTRNVYSDEAGGADTEDKKEMLITRFLEMIESVDIDEVETIDINTSIRYYNGMSESHYVSLEGE